MKRMLIAALFTSSIPVGLTVGAPAVPPWGVALADIDPSVKPGGDFFAYGNGHWLKAAKIPDDRAHAGVNLELDLQNEARLKSIVAGLAQKTSLTAQEQKLRDLYAAYMDQKAIEANGMKPAASDLAAIAAIKTRDDVARAMADPRLGLDGPFTLFPGVDAKHPDRYAVTVYQSGLGLPDRDYYLRADKQIVATREAYRKYLAHMLALAGGTDAQTRVQARAEAIFQLESALARDSWPAADRRDATRTYNAMTLTELKRLAPRFAWTAYFAAARIPTTSPRGERIVIVAEKSAFPKLSATFAATPVAVWRDYLTVRYLHSFAACLPKAVDEADFAMYGTVLAGKEKQLDRQTRAIELLDGTLGEALGSAYTAKYFPPDAKAKAKKLVDNLIRAYEDDIATLDWMTPETRAKALEKLHKLTPKIGYPDHWRDYSALRIERDKLIVSIQNAIEFEWSRRLRRIDQPVDKTEWDMTPQTNNAYYNPPFNEVVFPAGILQPPFFDPDADDAVNYGGIGATIGHEISHGFDDQGSKYDGDGVLRNWWTAADRRNFDARTAALAGQYDRYEPIPGVHINGRLTLGENIADLSGLVIAYKAYHLSLNGKPAPVLDGYTGDQRFYLAYAQSWRETHRQDALRSQLLSDPHSPSEYRVNGVVRNDDGWYAAFPGVRLGDPYYLPPGQRVRLW